jgi:hypothetical protein
VEDIGRWRLGVNGSSLSPFTKRMAQVHTCSAVFIIEAVDFRRDEFAFILKYSLSNLMYPILSCTSFL